MTHPWYLPLCYWYHQLCLQPQCVHTLSSATNVATTIATFGNMVRCV
jgi:hypothetical protein